MTRKKLPEKIQAIKDKYQKRESEKGSRQVSDKVCQKVAEGKARKQFADNEQFGGWVAQLLENCATKPHRNALSNYRQLAEFGTSTFCLICLLLVVFKFHFAGINNPCTKRLLTLHFINISQ